MLSVEKFQNLFFKEIFFSFFLRNAGWYLRFSMPFEMEESYIERGLPALKLELSKEERRNKGRKKKQKRTGQSRKKAKNISHFQKLLDF